MKTAKCLCRFSLLLSLVLGVGSAYSALAQEPEKPQTVAQTDEIFDTLDEEPNFGANRSDLMQYLGQNIRYPKNSQKKGEQGRVIVQFIVERDGSVRDAKVVRSVSKDLDKEALRVVRQMPKWTPGKKDGKAVRARFTLPVTFRLK